MAPEFVGLSNYSRVLADPYFWKALLNTAIVVAVVVHVELLIGLGMALLFASGVVAFLASDYASYINGATLDVNGDLYMA